jgi:hypothetical protein
MIVASVTLPFAKAIHVKAHEERERNREATVNVPHGDSASALTTTKPKPASAITTMNRIATAATNPDKPLISVRASSASDLPLAANAGGEDHEIVHRAAKTDADHQPQQSRQKSELRREHWANQRPAPEIAAK